MSVRELLIKTPFIRSSTNLFYGGDLVATKNKFEVTWTGKDPNPYLGEWHIKKNGTSIDQFFPSGMRTTPVFTYGKYPVWEEHPFSTVKQYVLDGFKMPEWIRVNMYWLQLMVDTDEDYVTLYNLFHELDFRTSQWM